MLIITSFEIVEVLLKNLFRGFEVSFIIMILSLSKSVSIIKTRFVILQMANFSLSLF